MISAGLLDAGWEMALAHPLAIFIDACNNSASEVQVAVAADGDGKGDGKGDGEGDGDCFLLVYVHGSCLFLFVCIVCVLCV